MKIRFAIALALLAVSANARPNLSKGTNPTPAARTAHSSGSHQAPPSRGNVHPDADPYYGGNGGSQHAPPSRGNVHPDADPYYGGNGYYGGDGSF